MEIAEYVVVEVDVVEVVASIVPKTFFVALPRMAVLAIVLSIRWSRRSALCGTGSADSPLIAVDTSSALYTKALNFMSVSRCHSAL